MSEPNDYRVINETTKELLVRRDALVDELLANERFPSREHIFAVSAAPKDIVHHSLEGLDAMRGGAEEFQEWRHYIATLYANKEVYKEASNG